MPGEDLVNQRPAPPPLNTVSHDYLGLSDRRSDKRRNDFINIMSINLKGFALKGPEFFYRPCYGQTSLLRSVVVEEHIKVIQLQVSSNHQRLPDTPFV